MPGVRMLAPLAPRQEGALSSVRAAADGLKRCVARQDSVAGQSRMGAWAERLMQEARVRGCMALATLRVRAFRQLGQDHDFEQH